MYDAKALLASVDTNPMLFIGLGGLAMIFNYTFFYEAIRAGRRDGVFAFPLAVSTVWFAHDLSFVLRFSEWFSGYSHWYVELFWIALIPTSVFELLFIAQTWRLGQPEIMPNGTRNAYTWFVLGSVLAGLVVWFATKEFLDDPIYVFSFGSVAFLAVPLAMRRIAARGDAKGQSTLMWAAFTLMLCCWYLAVLLFFGPAFKTIPQLALMLANVGGGAAMTYWVSRLSRVAQMKPVAAE